MWVPIATRSDLELVSQGFCRRFWERERNTIMGALITRSEPLSRSLTPAAPRLPLDQHQFLQDAAEAEAQSRASLTSMYSKRHYVTVGCKYSAKPIQKLNLSCRSETTSAPKKTECLDFRIVLIIERTCPACASALLDRVAVNTITGVRRAVRSALPTNPNQSESSQRHIVH